MEPLQHKICFTCVFSGAFNNKISARGIKHCIVLTWFMQCCQLLRIAWAWETKNHHIKFGPIKFLDTFGYTFALLQHVFAMAGDFICFAGEREKECQGRRLPPNAGELTTQVFVITEFVLKGGGGGLLNYIYKEYCNILLVPWIRFHPDHQDQTLMLLGRNFRSLVKVKAQWPRKSSTRWSRN